MSRAHHQQHPSTNVMGNRGVAWRILRALDASPVSGGRKPPSVGALVVALVSVMGCLVFVGSAQASKFVHEVVAEGSGSGVSGVGEFSTGGAQDVAVNSGSVSDGSVDPLGVSTAGFVYVADDRNHRIQVFDGDGEFRFMFGRGVLDGAAAAQVCTADDVPCMGGFSGASGGMFNRPQGVVIDQGTGHVFVRDRSNRRVQEFEADGSFVRAWGWDVVASGPGNDIVAPVNEFETCVGANGDVCQAGSAGTGLGQFSTSGFLNGGGIDLHAPSGDLLVADPGDGSVSSPRRIQRFDIPANATDPVSVVSAFGPFTGFASGGLGSVHIAVDDSGIVYAPSSAGVLARYDLGTSSFLAPLDVAAVTGTDPLAIPVGLEIDPATGNLFVARDRSLAGNRRFSPVLELGDPNATNPADVDLVDTHVSGSDYAWAGIGLDPDDGDLYLTGVSATNARSLLRAADGPSPPPSAVFLPPSEVTATTATLGVSIDPNGSWPVGYEIQVSTSSAPGDYEVVGSGQVPGGAPTPVSVDVTGLRPKSLYLVRVVVTKPYGNPDVVFDGPVVLTKAAAPSLADVGADSIDQDSARLRARIDPNGTGTSYRFDYGINGFQHSTPVPDGSVGSGYGYRFVSQQLTNLQPDTNYQYRLVTTSDDQALGTKTSQTGTFTTLATPGESARAYELVTPADKFGGQGVGFWPGGLGHLGSSGVAAHEGERFAALAQFGSTLDGDGAFSHSNDFVFAERGDSTIGWRSRSPLTHPNYAPRTGQPVEMRAATPDLSAMYWAAPSSLAFFPEMADEGPVGPRPGWSNFAVGLMSDWGGPFGEPTKWELFGPKSKDQIVDQALLAGGELFWLAFSADGSTVLAQTKQRAGSSGLSEVFGLAGAEDPTWPSPANPNTPGVPAYGDLVSGRSVYMGDLSDGMADSFTDTPDRELVNTCSGAAGVDRTQVPSSDGTSFAGQDCPAGIDGRDALVSRLGAALSPQAYIRKRMVSDDGSRVFFLAPDPLATGAPNGTTTFCSGMGTGSSCPPQLFVRQRNDDGSVVTRWVSKPEPTLFGQQVKELLGTARFEGASKDGSRVYFRTNTPLTVDDPNGLGSPTPGGVKTGTANGSSWDLYMVELADGSDPTGAGSTITRISAGPTSDGDCNSPRPTIESSTSVENDTVGALRFLSDDGDRAYFTCQAPLPGVDAPADATRITAPGGTQTTTDQANLYLYDHNQSQSDRWRFIARLPRAIGNRLATCATTGIERRSPFSADTGLHPNVTDNTQRSNCVNGTADGRFVTLFTEARLTIDDPVDPSGPPVADIYGYEADSNRLLRVSAPEGGDGGSYPCLGDRTSTPGDESLLYSCRGDGGMDAQIGVSHLAEGIAHLGVAQTGAGERLAFFQSASRLVPEDLDDGYDVYEWRDGNLSLVTSGSSDSQDALYKGNDVSGRNVYFVTRQALSWQDTDAVADIYSARVGGGIEESDPAPVCDVLGGACRGDGADKVAVPARETVSGSPDDTVDAGVRKTLSVSVVSARALRRASRSGRLVLSVRFNGAGRVSAVARARLAGRSRTIARQSVRMRSAGKATLTLRFSGQARKRLKAGKGLAVSVRVVSDGVRARSMTVRLPGVKS